MLGKLVLPDALEVNGVHQNHSRVGVQQVGRDQVLDQVVGAPLHPPVDGGRRLDILHEVYALRRREELLGQQLIKLLLQRVALHHEDLVGDAQDLAVLVRGQHLVEGLGDLGSVAGGQAQAVVQLAGSLALGAQPGHRRTGLDGEGREDDVLAGLLCRQLSIYVDGEEGQPAGVLLASGVGHGDVRGADQRAEGEG